MDVWLADWLTRGRSPQGLEGKVELLVKAAKRAIHFAVHKSRLSVPEFLTTCYEAANLLNERPIDTLPDLGSYLNAECTLF